MRIDTLDTYEVLIGSGVPDEQAKIQARLLAKAGELDLSDVATKKDLKHLEHIVYLFGGGIFVAIVVDILKGLFINGA